MAIKKRQKKATIEEQLDRLDRIDKLYTKYGPMIIKVFAKRMKMTEVSLDTMLRRYDLKHTLSTIRDLDHKKLLARAEKIKKRHLKKK